MSRKSNAQDPLVNQTLRSCAEMFGFSSSGAVDDHQLLREPIVDAYKPDE